MPARGPEQAGEATGAEPGTTMLDPTWTPEKGAAHAWELIRLLALHDDRKENP